MKLIRNESIGSFRWDGSSSSINSAQGANEWSQANIMKLLNPGYENDSVNGSFYWGRSKGTCYFDQTSTVSCDFTKNGLGNDAKSMIENAIWHTGSNGTARDFNSILTTTFYELERSSNTGKICTTGIYCNDTIPRTTKWIGKVGLLSPSDYGYATIGGSLTSRSICLNTILYSWDQYTDCFQNDWIFKISDRQWTINPSARPNQNSGGFFIYDGIVRGNGTISSNLDIVPSFYLNSNVRILNGLGSVQNPFEFSFS